MVLGGNKAQTVDVPDENLGVAVLLPQDESGDISKDDANRLIGVHPRNGVVQYLRRRHVGSGRNGSAHRQRFRASWPRAGRHHPPC